MQTEISFQRRNHPSECSLTIAEIFCSLFVRHVILI